MAEISDLENYITLKYGKENLSDNSEAVKTILSSNVTFLKTFKKRHITKDVSEKFVNDLIQLSELYLVKADLPDDADIEQFKVNISDTFKRMEEDITLLHQKIDENHQNLIEVGKNIHHLQHDIQLRNKATYAEIASASAHLSQIETSHTSLTMDDAYPIIFKRVQPGDHEDTKKMITSKINIITLNIRILRMKTIKDGGIIIYLPTKDEQNKLFTHLKSLSSLREKLTFYLPKIFFPRIRVNSVDPIFTEKNLIDSICDHNSEIPEDHDIKIITTFPQKYGNAWILECNPKTFHILIKKQKLYLGWNSYRIEESINVRRCVRCGKFGHTSKKCEAKDDICTNCGVSGHHYKTNNEITCSNPSSCINCTLNNEKYKTRFDTKHHTMDKQCPSLLREKKFLQARITYS